MREVSDKLFWRATRINFRDKQTEHNITSIDIIPNPTTLNLSALQCMYSKIYISSNNYDRIQKKDYIDFKIGFNMPIIPDVFIIQKKAIYPCTWSYTVGLS